MEKLCVFSLLDVEIVSLICLFDIRFNLPVFILYRKVTLLMVGLDNAGKTSTVADLTGGL